MPWFLTWGIGYEFLRVATHPRVNLRPWSASEAYAFLDALLRSPSARVLTPSARHAEVLAAAHPERFANACPPMLAPRAVVAAPRGPIRGSGRNPPSPPPSPDPVDATRSRTVPAPGVHAEVAREPEADGAHPIPARRRAGPEDTVKKLLLASLPAAVVAMSVTASADPTRDATAPTPTAHATLRPPHACPPVSGARPGTAQVWRMR